MVPVDIIRNHLLLHAIEPPRANLINLPFAHLVDVSKLRLFLFSNLLLTFLIFFVKATE